MVLLLVYAMMRSVYLLLGTNQGNRQNNLKTAIGLLSDQVANVTARSAIYETAAWGETDQPGFLNQAVQLETDLRPEALLTKVKDIEQQVGRTATYRWGPREIDIDILFMGAETYQSDQLIIPHKELQNRRFALVPLCELAGDAQHPILQQSLTELLQNCPDKLAVTILKEDE